MPNSRFLSNKLTKAMRTLVRVRAERDHLRKEYQTVISSDKLLELLISTKMKIFLRFDLRMNVIKYTGKYRLCHPKLRCYNYLEKILVFKNHILFWLETILCAIIQSETVRDKKFVFRKAACIWTVKCTIHNARHLALRIPGKLQQLQ